MVEKIYLEDAYAKELTAGITAVNLKELELDRTIFYPTGGGEPCDTGTISMKGVNHNVLDVKKIGDRVIHIMENLADLHVGDVVECRIDWNRRYTYMRHHTAIHVISGLMEERYNAMFTGGQIGIEKSHFDFDMPQLNRQLAEEIVNESQKIMDRGLNVIVKNLTKEEALKVPNLVRTEPGRQLLESLKTVRVVEIEGFDVQMDGGTHVKNTSEIGKVRLSDFKNKGTHSKRIEISLGEAPNL